MNKPKKQSTTPKESAMSQMPFDEALKRLWSSPPQHIVKSKTKKAKKKTGA